MTLHNRDWCEQVRLTGRAFWLSMPVVLFGVVLTAWVWADNAAGLWRLLTR